MCRYMRRVITLLTLTHLLGAANRAATTPPQENQ